jgi:hypothetical protein
LKLFLSFVTPSWVADLKAVASRCASCHRLVILRQFSARKAGIRMHGSWYCSGRCFCSAAEREILRFGTSGSAPASHNSRMPLGLNLMSRGWLTAEQLKKATDEQKETGGEIGEVLVRQGSVSEKQVTEIRSAEWGCPVFTLPKHAAQIGIQVPSTLIRAYFMIPVHYVAATNLLYVGFVHSIEYGLLYAVEQLTGCKTTPCFVTPTAFQSEMEHTKQLQQRSAEPPAKELNFEGIQTPAEIGRILCDTGLQMEAEEAFIGNCKEYVWARLKNGHKSADLLFKVG